MQMKNSAKRASWTSCGNTAAGLRKPLLKPSKLRLHCSPEARPPPPT